MWILLKGKGCGGVRAGAPKGVSIQQLLRKYQQPPHQRAGKGSRGKHKAVTYSLQPKVFPLAPLFWMWGKSWKEQNLMAARWTFQEKLLAQGKGSIHLSAQRMHTDTLGAWTGKQHLCRAGTLPGAHTQLWSPPLPFPGAFQGSWCCNCVNIQYFAHSRIRVIFHVRVTLACHVLPSPAEQKWFTRKEGKISSMMWHLTSHPTTAAGRGWNYGWTAVEKYKWLKEKFHLKSKLSTSAEINTSKNRVDIHFIRFTSTLFHRKVRFLSNSPLPPPKNTSLN